MVRELGQGGTERQLTETAKALDRTQFEPHVGCMIPEGLRLEELKAAGVPILKVPVRSLYRASAITGARKMGAYLRRHDIQLVHTFDAPMNLFAVPAARFYNAPVVLSSQRAYRTLVSGIGRHLLRITDQMVDGIVVNCKAMERHLTEDEKVAPRHVHLCYNGIDTSVFHPNDRRESGGATIGVVCALRPEKDLPTLVKAFARMVAVKPDGRLLIAGNGPVKPQLEEMAAQLGISDRCRFEPATSQVAERLREIDIFVLPSRSEALSNSLMEAMACGCAVIASRVGGNPELVDHMRTGLLFEPGSVDGLASMLQILIADPNLRRGISSNGASYVRKNFSLERSVRRIEDVYASFLR